MPTRLTGLTPDQQAATGGWAERYVARALSTEPADRRRFEAAAERCYRHAGLEWHGNVVWVENPVVVSLAGSLTSYVLKEFDRKRGHRRLCSVGGASSAVHWGIYAAVGSAVHKAIYAAIEPSVHRSVNLVRLAVELAVDSVQTAIVSAVGSAAETAVGPKVESAVYSAVRSAVDAAVDADVDWAVRLVVDSAVDPAGNRAIRTGVRSAWRNNLGGVPQASWHAYASFFREVCNLELQGDLWEREKAFADAQLSAGGWWPHRQFVIVSERASEICLEPGRNGGRIHRLHSESGPAIAYPDGWGLYFWHGVPVPEHVIKGEFDHVDIDREPNAEIRRCMIEKYGADRYLAEAGAREVHRDDWGTLYRRELPGDEDLVMVEVVNATPGPDGSFKSYWIRVPPQVRTAHEAVAWTFGKESEAYRPSVQT